MIYNKANFAVAHAAAKNEIRPALANVRFEPRATVATDSYMLIKVSALTVDEIDISKAPNIQLPAKNIKKTPTAVLHTEIFTQNDILTENPATAQTESEDSGVEYPDYHGIIPTNSKFEIVLNAELIARMIAAYKEFNGGFAGLPSLKFAFNGMNDPVKITSENPNSTGQSFTGLIMPIRQ